MWVGGRFGELLTHAVNTAETEDGGGGRQRAWKITVQELKSVAKPWFNLNFSARRESWKQKTFSYVFLSCCAALLSEYLLLPHPGNTERHRCHLKQQELCPQMFFCIKRIQEVVGRSNESAKLKHHKLVYLYALKNQTKTSNNAQQLNVCAQLTLILMLKSSFIASSQEGLNLAKSHCMTESKMFLMIGHEFNNERQQLIRLMLHHSSQVSVTWEVQKESDTGLLCAKS